MKDFKYRKKTCKIVFIKVIDALTEGETKEVFQCLRS